jgi:hypothetical protein
MADPPRAYNNTIQMGHGNTTSTSHAPGRLMHAMFALGNRQPPPMIRHGHANYSLVSIVKHDFWALTAFYDDEQGNRIVFKSGRTADFHGIPFLGIGRWLTRREIRFYRSLADLPNVPRLLGTIGQTAFLHSYVPGRPLDRKSAVPDRFFAELHDVISQVHQRDIAYVDMNKSTNILLGDDGRPYLIDFQISADLHEWGDWFFTRWWLARLQREDRYHLLKHKRRLRPDELTPDEKLAVAQCSLLIRLHRAISKPYFLIRRWLFRRLREQGRLHPQTTG